MLSFVHLKSQKSLTHLVICFLGCSFNSDQNSCPMIKWPQCLSFLDPLDSGVSGDSGEEGDEIEEAETSELDDKTIMKLVSSGADEVKSKVNVSLSPHINLSLVAVLFFLESLPLTNMSTLT